MIRLRKNGQPIFLLMIFLTLLISVPVQPALAALVDTQTFISESDPDQLRTHLINLIAHEDVRIALLRHGLIPIEVEAQIAALTDQEISQISRTIDEAPAGGMAAVAIPIWLAILILLGYLLVITGVISLGVYAGTKITEQQNEEFAKSTPFPAPSRVAPVPSVNPNEPWTGKWKVNQSRISGVWVFKQTGEKVVSTSESDYVVDAKVYGAMIRGTWSDKSIRSKGDFQATIAEDGLSFNANATFQTTVHFTGNKVE